MRSGSVLISGFMLLALATACTTTPTSGDLVQQISRQKKLEFLMKLGDSNESAAYYQEVCRQDQKRASDTFIRNYKASSDMLFDTLMTQENKSGAEASAFLTKRRSTQRAALDALYSKQGCTGSTAQDSYLYYQQVSNQQPEDWQKQLQGIVDGLD